MVWYFIGVYIVKFIEHYMAARLGAHSLDRSEEVKYFTTRKEKLLISKRPWNILYTFDRLSTYLIDLVVYVFWLMHIDKDNMYKDNMSTKINELTDHLLKVFWF